MMGENHLRGSRQPVAATRSSSNRGWRWPRLHSLAAASLPLLAAFAISTCAADVQTADCGAVYPGYSQELDVNRNGYDSYSFYGPGPTDCIANCSSTSSCVGFVLYQQDCYIKYFLNSETNYTGADTYVVCTLPPPYVPPPPPPSAACGAVYPGYSKEQDINRDGYDSYSFYGPGPAECVANCSSTASCVGFVLYEQVCYIKYFLNSETNDTGVDTYVMCTSAPSPPPPSATCDAVVPDYSLETDTNRNGYDYTYAYTNSSSNVTACTDFCDSDSSRCLGFVFVRSASVCFFKYYLNETSSLDGVDTYVRCALPPPPLSPPPPVIQPPPPPPGKGTTLSNNIVIDILPTTGFSNRTNSEVVSPNVTVPDLGCRASDQGFTYYYSMYSPNGAYANFTVVATLSAGLPFDASIEFYHEVGNTGGYLNCTTFALGTAGDASLLLDVFLLPGEVYFLTVAAASPSAPVGDGSFTLLSSFLALPPDYGSSFNDSIVIRIDPLSGYSSYNDTETIPAGFSEGDLGCLSGPRGFTWYYSTYTSQGAAANISIVPALDGTDTSLPFPVVVELFQENNNDMSNISCANYSVGAVGDTEVTLNVFLEAYTVYFLTVSTMNPSDSVGSGRYTLLVSFFGAPAYGTTLGDSRVIGIPTTGPSAYNDTETLASGGTDVDLGCLAGSRGSTYYYSMYTPLGADANFTVLPSTASSDTGLQFDVSIELYDEVGNTGGYFNCTTYAVGAKGDPSVPITAYLKPGEVYFLTVAIFSSNDTDIGDGMYTLLGSFYANPVLPSPPPPVSSILLPTVIPITPTGPSSFSDLGTLQTNISFPDYGCLKDGVRGDTKYYSLTQPFGAYANFSVGPVAGAEAAGLQFYTVVEIFIVDSDISDLICYAINQNYAGRMVPVVINTYFVPGVIYYMAISVKYPYLPVGTGQYALAAEFMGNPPPPPPSPPPPPPAMGTLLALAIAIPVQPPTGLSTFSDSEMMRDNSTYLNVYAELGCLNDTVRGDTRYYTIEAPYGAAVNLSITGSSGLQFDTVLELYTVSAVDGSLACSTFTEGDQGDPSLVFHFAISPSITYILAVCVLTPDSPVGDGGYTLDASVLGERIPSPPPPSPPPPPPANGESLGMAIGLPENPPSNVANASDSETLRPNVTYTDLGCLPGTRGDTRYYTTTTPFGAAVNYTLTGLSGLGFDAVLELYIEDPTTMNVTCVTSSTGQAGDASLQLSSMLQPGLTYVLVVAALSPSTSMISGAYTLTASFLGDAAPSPPSPPHPPPSPPPPSPPPPSPPPPGNGATLGEPLYIPFTQSGPASYTNINLVFSNKTTTDSGCLGGLRGYTVYYDFFSSYGTQANFTVSAGSDLTVGPPFDAVVELFIVDGITNNLDCLDVDQTPAGTPPVVSSYLQGGNAFFLTVSVDNEATSVGNGLFSLSGSFFSNSAPPPPPSPPVRHRPPPGPTTTIGKKLHSPPPPTIATSSFFSKLLDDSTGGPLPPTGPPAPATPRGAVAPPPPPADTLDASVDGYLDDRDYLDDRPPAVLQASSLLPMHPPFAESPYSRRRRRP